MVDNSTDTGNVNGVNERFVSRGKVDASRVRVWEDELCLFHVTIDDEEFTDVRAVQAFPITEIAPFVSFLDTEEREIAMLADPDNLGADSQAALRKALNRMYYIATITEVIEITETMGVGHWRVMTDRGYATFDVVSREQIRELDDGRFVIPDAEGNRFEIPNVNELDEDSQSMVLSET